jgi:hypothetical protein
VVYSSDSAFIEREFVAGFLSSEKTDPESIRVFYPYGTQQPQFQADPEEACLPKVLLRRA